MLNTGLSNFTYLGNDFLCVFAKTYILKKSFPIKMEFEEKEVAPPFFLC